MLGDAGDDRYLIDNCSDVIIEGKDDVTDTLGISQKLFNALIVGHRDITGIVTFKFSNYAAYRAAIRSFSSHGETRNYFPALEKVMGWIAYIIIGLA
ncbi:MAG: hypothetical protein P8M25_13165 [Paracoccaceae bacterium]|nr:hypothetical protein [Paracoccaceae bacterium]